MSATGDDVAVELVELVVDPAVVAELPAGLLDDLVELVELVAANPAAGAAVAAMLRKAARS